MSLLNQAEQTLCVYIESMNNKLLESASIFENPSSPIPNLAEKTNAQREGSVRGHVGRARIPASVQGSLWIVLILSEAMCLASLALMGKADAGKKLFFRIKSPWEQNKSEVAGEGRGLMTSETAQLRS